MEKIEGKITHGWKELYPGAKEEEPPDRPEPLMKPMSITGIYDASHTPCLVTRRSVIVIALLVNNIVI